MTCMPSLMEIHKIIILDCNFMPDYYHKRDQYTSILFVNNQGFNATLTEPIETPGRRGGDQIKEMELKLHPKLKGPLTKLCNDPKTTIVVLSGSETRVLDDVRHLLFSCLTIDFMFFSELVAFADLW